LVENAYYCSSKCHSSEFLLRLIFEVDRQTLNGPGICAESRILDTQVWSLPYVRSVWVEVTVFGIDPQDTPIQGKGLVSLFHRLISTGAQVKRCTSHHD
jgi:hypothetical protein